MNKKKSAPVEAQIKPPRDKLLPKFTIFFFDRTKITAFLWIALTIFGTLCYTTLLKREGFPSINIPLSFVGGAYFVNDAVKVDNDVAKPIAEIAVNNPSVSSVQTKSASNFFTVTILFKDGVDAKAVSAEIQQQVKDTANLPPQVSPQFNVPYFGATGGDIEQINIAVSFYSTDGAATTEQLVAKANEAAEFLKSRSLSLVTDVFVKDPFQETTNPATGQLVTVQRNFDQFGIREDKENNFYNSVIIGISSKDGADVIKLDDEVGDAVAELNSNEEFAGYAAEISASFAPEIKENISELQKVLLEGLLAILIVGSIVIAVRASIITVISLITIVLATLAFLYLIGFTLNVITLFALILALALIVDDTIIMVEAIDGARHRHNDAREIVKDATRKVSRAMVAATLTAALSFAPLLFVGGILGSFIRAIPITIIASLLISLLVALVFIPFFSRYILLTKKQIGKKSKRDYFEYFESKIANFIAAPMLWARHSKKKLFFVGTTAVLIGFGFFAAGIFIARNVVFNIFPPTKDTNGIVVSLSFPSGTDIKQAEAIAEQANQLTSEVLGENFVQSSYFASGTAQNATNQIEIISYSKRDVTSPELVDELQNRFNNDFTLAKANVGQVDVGPPSAAFTVQIAAENREAAFAAGDDLSKFLESAELERPNGTVARIVNVEVSSQDEFIRAGTKEIITVSGSFDGNDTSTLVTLAQNAVEKEYTAEKLASFGLSEDALTFDIGQESENQDSFKTLAIAFPILLFVMYILLGIQFKSFLQPLLIFLAIPFSIFGIMLGLDITENAISFFAMLGFFALIGLSIKNTILVTDFANQARRQGMSAVDAAAAALKERFRPLFATSVTAVVSLIPLAISSPFWEGLAVVLIFGLVSSTFLVVTVFPYYYLGAEYLRIKISAKRFMIWIVPTVLIAILVGALTNPGYGLLVFPLSILAVIIESLYERVLVKR